MSVLDGTKLQHLYFEMSSPEYDSNLKTHTNSCVATFDFQQVSLFEFLRYALDDRRRYDTKRDDAKEMVCSAVAVSSIKRRGGMGINLAFGICIAMIFVFFDKIFGVMASQSDFPPLLAVWFPNMLFGILALYLLYHAKR